ncbi:MAG: hypothetical protein ABI416_05280 [Ginsengibacter sp.]
MVISQKFLRASGLAVFSVFLTFQNGFSFSVVRPVPNEIKTENPMPGYFKASAFVKLSAREFAAATGKKLSFFQRIYFKVVQRQMKRDLKKNPDLLITDYFDTEKTKFKFDLLWFVIASIIGPLGVLLAYGPHQKQKKEITTKKDKITSAWLGFLFWVLWFGYLFVF